MRLLSRCRHYTCAAADRIEAGKYFYLYCFLMLFLYVAAVRAASRALWYDELLTFYMSHLPSMRAVWAGLRSGADLNPPFLYIATRASLRLFGDGPVGARVPAMAGFVVMSICLFRFVSRRTNGLYGLVAMLFPWITGAARYAYEARSYGLVLGFSGIALVCWQGACEQKRRWWSLAGLTIGITGALMSHCYAVLLFVPLGAGELVRTVRARRIDWAVWLAILIPAPLVLTYLPLMRTNNGVALANAKFEPRLASIWEFAVMVLGPAIWTWLAAFAVVLLPARRASESPDAPAKSVPVHELAAAAGLVSVPLCVLIMAFTITRIFETRYGLLAVVGFAILFTLLAYARTANRRITGVLLVATFLAGFLVNSFWAPPDDTPQSMTIRGIEPDQVEKDLPFVIANGTLFLQVDHFAKPELTSRLYLLRDSQAAVRYTGSNVFEIGYPILQSWFPIKGHVEDYQTFISRHDRFMVFGPMHDPLDWLIFKLVDDGAQMNFRGQFGDSLLFEVTPKPTLSARRAGN
ncbi:MAG TPA: glycosyltransferase family 39 protein [Bryobacteraceae bacterium]|nr:glycosyltransferase family 39 protein [Bryobacteraceae bacterium]